jgi:hypothetical protein
LGLLAVEELELPDEREPPLLEPLELLLGLCEPPLELLVLEPPPELWLR